MSNFYGGNDILGGNWWTATPVGVKVVFMILVALAMVWVIWNLVNHQVDTNNWSWTPWKENFSERPLSNVGTLYDAAGLAARQNQIASNAGYEGMVGKHQKSHLVGGYDRPATWVPGLNTNMPNGWMNTTDPTPEVSEGDVRAGKTTVSGMSNSLGGDLTLANALNSM